jgi:hypothetical protein
MKSMLHIIFTLTTNLMIPRSRLGKLLGDVVISQGGVGTYSDSFDIQKSYLLVQYHTSHPSSYRQSRRERLHRKCRCMSLDNLFYIHLYYWLVILSMQVMTDDDTFESCNNTPLNLPMLRSFTSNARIARVIAGFEKVGAACGKRNVAARAKECAKLIKSVTADI